MAISAEEQQEVLTQEGLEYFRPDIFVCLKEPPVVVFQQEIDEQETKEALVKLIQQRRGAALKARGL